jgi:hypothetical protein
MLVDIITNIIAPQPDMDIVHEGGSTADLLDAARQSSADIVITVHGVATARKDYDDLLYSDRHIKVIEIFAEGRLGSLYVMQPRRVALGEMSPPRLLEAIRGSADIAAGVTQ